jgi:hypothetical protein
LAGSSTAVITASPAFSEFPKPTAPGIPIVQLDVAEHMRLFRFPAGPVRVGAMYDRMLQFATTRERWVKSCSTRKNASRHLPPNLQHSCRLDQICAASTVEGARQRRATRVVILARRDVLFAWHYSDTTD